MRRLGLLGLLLAIALSLSASALVQPREAQAASLCPELVNAYLPPDTQLVGDLDLCKWSTTSAFGDYATVDPTKVVEYPSCAAWKDDFRRWLDAGSPKDSPPGLVGHTDTLFTAIVTAVGKDPAIKGNFRVRIALQPAATAPNPSRIFLTRPVWPGMSSSQVQRIDQILSQLLVHERGHQNLSGHVATTFEEVVSVPAKNAKAAVKLVSTDPNWAPATEAMWHASSRDIHVVYDRLTSNSVTQSALGGTDVLAFDCGDIDLTYSLLVARSVTRPDCGPPPSNASSISEHSTKEETTFAPPPPTYLFRISTRDEGCQLPNDPDIPAVVEELPGSPAVSGEARDVLSRSAQDWTIVYPFTGEVRVLHHEATGTASATFVNEDGRLSFTGAVTCHAMFSDTKTSPTSENSWVEPHASGTVILRFTVATPSNFTMNLEGHWSGINRDVAVIAVGQGWADFLDASALGTTYTKTLTAGLYELRFGQGCTAPVLPLTEVGERSGEINYTVTVEN